MLKIIFKSKIRNSVFAIFIMFFSLQSCVNYKVGSYTSDQVDTSNQYFKWDYIRNKSHVNIITRNEHLVSKQYCYNKLTARLKRISKGSSLSIVYHQKLYGDNGKITFEEIRNRFSNKRIVIIYDKNGKKEEKNIYYHRPLKGKRNEKF